MPRVMAIVITARYCFLHLGTLLVKKMSDDKLMWAGSSSQQFLHSIVCVIANQTEE